MESLGLRGILITLLKVYGLNDETRARIVFNVEKCSRECGGKLQGQQELEEMVDIHLHELIEAAKFTNQDHCTHTKSQECSCSYCNYPEFCSLLERTATFRNSFECQQ